MFVKVEQLQLTNAQSKKQEHIRLLKQTQQKALQTHRATPFQCPSCDTQVPCVHYVCWIQLDPENAVELSWTSWTTHTLEYHGALLPPRTKRWLQSFAREDSLHKRLLSEHLVVK